MPTGTLENTSGGQLIIEGLGWVLPSSHTETVDELSEEPYVWTRAGVELSALITASDIVIRDESSNIIAAANVLSWINSVGGGNQPLAPQLFTFPGFFDGKIPSNGIMWLSHNTEFSFIEHGFLLAADSVLRSMQLTLDVSDGSRTYDLRIYEDPTTTPILRVSNTLVTTTGNTEFTADDLSIALTAGTYGLRLDRVTGSGKSSFTQGVAYIIAEIR